MGIWRYLCDIDVVICVVVIGFFIYFAWKAKKKKYKFTPLGDIPKTSSKKTKKKKKKNKNEERVREIFEDIFKVRFKTIRPDWLKNPATGKNLELDGYNADIKTPLGKGLAFEYDGQQHSKYTPHFHKHGPQQFLYQVKCDTWKDLQCKERGVLLVRIPSFVAYHDLERYTKDKLQRLKLI